MSRRAAGSAIHVIIPARDEEASLPVVLGAIPRRPGVRVLVVDNGSSDLTAAVAKAGGAHVIVEPRVGYGAACLAALARLRDASDSDVAVFLDADGSDDPSMLLLLVEPILRDDADLVLASRTLAAAEPGALTAAQRFGNWLSCHLIAALWGFRYTDLAPYRAARLGTLRKLEMEAPGFGWTVEMQIRAARSGLRILEVPSRYRKRRRGRSKVSGTVVGSLRAGVTILYTIGREVVGRTRRNRDRSDGGATPRANVNR